MVFLHNYGDYSGSKQLVLFYSIYVNLVRGQVVYQVVVFVFYLIFDLPGEFCFIVSPLS